MPSGKTRNKILQSFFIYAFLVFISLVSVWAVVLNFKQGIVGYGDSLFITWVLNQNIQKIPFGLQHFFQGNIFYPFRDVIAYSDVFLPSSILAYLPVKFLKLPVVAFNFNIILGQTITVLVLYFWFNELTKNRLAALLGSTVFAFSQIRMFFRGYLQMWTMQWFLLSLYMLWKYKEYKSRKYLLFCAIFGVIQMWESPLPVLFLIFSGALMFFVNNKKHTFNLKDFILPTFVFLLGVLPLTIKYISVSRTFETTRSIRESAHFAMSINDIGGILSSPGLFLIFLTSYLLLNRNLLQKIKDFYWLIGVGVLGFVMSLGPVLKVNGSTFKLFGNIFIPLPYAVFYYIFPVFKSMRTPLRWIFLFAFALSGLISIMVSKINIKFRKPVILLSILVSVIGGATISAALPVPKPESYPIVYGIIENLPGKVILELPIYSWGDGEPFQREFWRMFYSLEHKKSLVNGASGLNPPEWEKLFGFIRQEFPGRQAEYVLANIGVDYIIVHKDEFEKEKLEEIVRWGKKNIIWEDNSNVVYALN